VDLILILYFLRLSYIHVYTCLDNAPSLNNSFAHLSWYTDKSEVYSYFRRDRLEETRPCYISVISSWPKVKCTNVFHFRLELLLQQPVISIVNNTSPIKQDGENENTVAYAHTYCAFTLAFFSLIGVLVINTGVCIVYVQCQKSHLRNDISLANSPFLHVCYECSR